MFKFFKRLSFLLFVPVMLLQASGPQDASKAKEPKVFPNVLVTIKPLYSLTYAIMEGVAEPTLLLNGAEDPHHFSMTPSHARLMRKADLLVWVGPMLEGFMVKSLVAVKKRNVPLMSSKGLQLLHRKNSHGCVLEEACVGAEKAKKKDDTKLYEKQHVAIDPHIWLDIDNVIAMVREITFHLGAFDLAHAGIYQRNSRKLIEKLEAFKIEIHNKAAPLAHFHFIAFHDAYGYLEHRYKLKNSAAMTIKGHGAPSLKSYAKIRSIIKQKDIRCILVEPQHASELEKKLAVESKMSLYEADPLGIQIDAGPEHYFTLMRDLIGNFEKCYQEHDAKK